MQKIHVVLLERAHDHTESLLLQVKTGGHEAHVCYTTDECVDAARRLKPSVVLLNAGLPMERVYELGRRLRELDAARPTVLRVAQPGDQIDCRTSMESGIRFHLAKPIYASVLQKTIDTCTLPPSEN